jgi:hypothetical protein
MVFLKNKIKYLVFGKFHCILFLNSSFDGSLIFNFLLTLIWCFSSHFSFYFCDKHNVIISKIHDESTRFWNSSIPFYVISIKIYCNMDV